jgi:non-ribosomal peptide synthetase component F
MGTGYARQYIYYSPQTTLNIDLFLQQHRLVYATLIYAVWAMLLGGYANENDVVFGVIYSGRTIAAATGIEYMVGNSINVLPVRMKIEPNKNILTWLKEIFQQQSQANHFEYTPLAKIKEWCGIPHKKQMFDSYIVMQNLPTPNFEDASDNKEYIEMLKDQGIGKKVKGVGEIPQNSRHAHLFFAEMEYPLRVDIYMLSQLCPVFNYFRQHLADSVIKGYMENMKLLLESIIENPYQKVGDLMNQINPEKYPVPENYSNVDFV